MFRLGLSCLLLRVFVVSGTEFTFELADNDKQCFYEELDQGTRFEIGYHVSACDGFSTFPALWLFKTVKLLFN